MCKRLKTVSSFLFKFEFSRLITVVLIAFNLVYFVHSVYFTVFYDNLFDFFSRIVIVCDLFINGYL